MSTNHVSYILITVLNAWSIFDQSVLIFTGRFLPSEAHNTLAGESRSVNFAASVRKSSRSNNGESPCPPGPLPRTTPESHDVLPACCRGEHHCLLSVCPKFRQDYSLGFGQLFNRLNFASFSSRTVLCFPLFWGEIHLSTGFRLLLWAISHNDPVHAVCWGFSTELLREWTVHKLNYVHESSRFSSCSSEHLRIVSPQPRTPTIHRRLRLAAIADIVAYRRMKSTVSTHCSCEFSTPVVCALDFWLWLIDYSELKLLMTYYSWVNVWSRFSSEVPWLFSIDIFLSGIPYHTMAVFHVTNSTTCPSFFNCICVCIYILWFFTTWFLDITQ